MRICIYGAGAMGTSLGALLTKSGTACDLVTRNAAHVEAMRRGGAVLGNLPAIPVSALTPEELRGTYDVIFLTTKQRENDSVCMFLLDYLKEDGMLVTCQNGLPEEGIAEVVGADRVYGCTLTWGAELVSPGKVKISSSGGYPVAVGAYGSGARLGELVEILKGVGTVTVGNLAELRFAKLVTNASLSTLSAISGLTFGELAKHYKRYVLSLIRETLSVAKAYGCKRLILNGHDLYKVFGAFGRFTLPVAVKNYRDTRSGMLLDLNAGRRCDVDFVAGAVVRAGEKKGVECPNLANAVALVHDIENGLAELSPETLQLL